MSELSEESVSVVDVYDLASDIGKECEKIIDIYGSESVSSLIPKCIRALELLEALASRNERETSVVQELNDRITQLENEKVEKAETRKRFEKVSGFSKYSLYFVGNQQSVKIIDSKALAKNISCV
jgi:uncharacterized protein (UPF0305 family)